MRRPWSRRARIIGWTSFLVVGVLVAGALSFAIAVRMQLAGIQHIAKIDTKHRPPKYTNALNILLLGSDTRSGANGAIGGHQGCNCSDTIMLAHISPGRQRVTVLSIPRDTMVPYYACSATDGLAGQQADAYAYERINATLANGGPECTRETVEQQTGIYIDNVILLDFTGFEKVINDIGGVNVCIPFAIHNRISAAGGSGLNLSAGKHHIDGRVALQFWRTRDNIANGSDIERIARDQYLSAQIVKGVLHSGLLDDPTRLYTVIGDISHAITTDASDLQLLHIALSLRGISLKHIQFLTAPWVPYPPDPNEVEFKQPQADAVFYAIAHDSKLPKAQKKQKGKEHGKGTGGGAQLMTVDPDTVQVTLLDGSSGADLTTQASTALTSRGFTVVGTGYAPATTYTTSVVEYHGKADLAAANTVKEQFSDATLKLVPAVQAGIIDVILGSTFTELAPPVPTSVASMNSLSSEYGGITATARCRNSAFYGYFDHPRPGHADICAC